MDDSAFARLPLELIEIVCDISLLYIDRHHVRSQLRATCISLRSSLLPAQKMTYNDDIRAAYWFQHGATLEFIIGHNLYNEKDIIKLAATTGRLDIMTQYRGRYCEQFTANVCGAAAEAGHLSCLKYARDNYYDPLSHLFPHTKPYPFPPDIALMAARGGNLQCLQYVHQNCCDRSPSTCEIAATYGHFECLMYAHENGFHWDEATCCFAAINGHLACLQYSIENGCPHTKHELLRIAMQNNKPRCVLYLHQEKCDQDKAICSWAAQHGYLLCLKNAQKLGCCWDKDVCRNAASNGHIDCLRFAHENGCDWDWDTTGAAAESGHIDCLRYAYENGCSIDSVFSCWFASYHGHLLCLRYVYENCHEWNEDTCDSAASEGHLLCLKYAHENGCPWTGNTCRYAARNGHLACLKYAYKNGCSWPVYDNQEIHPDCLSYARINHKIVLPYTRKC